MPDKAVEVKNLNYAYPDGTAALKDICLDVFQQEAVALVGPNGAGKSTLLLHLNGILKGTGSVKIMDLEVHDENLGQIRKNVGLVFQDPDNQLFMPTVFDDVSFGPINMGLTREKAEEASRDALGKVDMREAAGRLSHHLSFGEKKRVSIATVLSMSVEILALDEPSSNLDPKHRRDLINFLKKIKLTRVIATHDLDLVLEVCSRAVLIDKGRIIMQGDTQDILGNAELLEAHGLEVPAALKKPQDTSFIYETQA